MARVEAYPGHGSLFRKQARERNNRFYNGEGSSPCSRLPEWPKVDPRGLYEVNEGEIYIPGNQFPEGILPANASLVDFLPEEERKTLLNQFKDFFKNNFLTKSLRCKRVKPYRKIASGRPILLF